MPVRKGRAFGALVVIIVSLSLWGPASTVAAVDEAGAELTTVKVNAGGAATTPGWEGDTTAAPSSSFNAFATGNRTKGTANTIVMRNPTIPTGTPMRIFQTARTTSGPTLQWSRSVEPGTYEVRLYFAEIDPNVQATGLREFDVTINGQKVLSRLDIFAATGGYTGSVRSFVVPSAGSITVSFTGVKGQPLVSGIEVLGYVPPPPSGGVGQWTVLPESRYRRSEQTFTYSSRSQRFYLVGGIGKVEGDQVRLIEEYNPATRTWATVGALPTNINHVQAVEANGQIYIIAGWVAPFATYVFDPVTHQVTTKAKMPRPRGAGGVAVHDGKIYYAGGLDPFTRKSTPWTSVYDVATDKWSELPDMPRARDHFGAAIVDGKLHAIAGRHVVREEPVVDHDVFDLTTGRWSTGYAPIPTARSGTATAVIGREIVVLGGEIVWSQPTKRLAEAYNVDTGTWRQLAPMPVGLHGIQAATCNGSIYVAGGAFTPGAKDPSVFTSTFSIGERRPCPGIDDAPILGVRSGAEVAPPSSAIRPITRFASTPPRNTTSPTVELFCDTWSL